MRTICAFAFGMAALIAASQGMTFAQSRAMTGAVSHSPAVHAVAPAPAGRTTTVRISGGFDRGPRSRRFARSGFYGYGYGWPYANSDYDGHQEPPVIEQQPAPQSVPVVQFMQEPVSSPALLELQGDHWVKVTSFVTGTSALDAKTASAANELPPAVLVYRDGHSEEVSSYSIIGETIYTKADYWTSGSWERKIQIADLDVPATLKQNRDRGVKFELPSGPNEVMLRP